MHNSPCDQIELLKLTEQIILINHIKSTAINREFKEFLKYLEAEYGDVVFNSEVCWLTRGAILKRV